MHDKINVFGKRFRICPAFMMSIYSKVLKLKFVLSYRDWTLSYFKLYKPSFRDFEFRKAILAHYLSKLPTGREVTIIGRSAGAILATQLADQFAIKKVICLGYPFKHPDKEEESYRTEHLQHIIATTLIFQGENDVYGNVEQAKKYKLSSAIQLFSFETDHEYQCTEAELDKIKEFI